MGCHFLLQGTLSTQGLYPHLLHWQADSLPLSPQAALYSSVGLRIFSWLCKRSPELFHLAQLNSCPLSSNFSFSSPSSPWQPFYFLFLILHTMQSLVTQMIKESACSAGDPDSIPESGRSPGDGDGYTLQYPCLENPIDRGA